MRHKILTSGMVGDSGLKSRKLFFLFMILISIAAMLLSREPGEEHIVVIAETDKAVMELSVEEYLVGAMAAVTEPEYEEECQKALAVLIRGNLMRNREGEEMEIRTDEPYYDFSTRRQLYGEHQQEYEERLEEAVTATTGLIAVSGNQILEGNFHALSAGVTRAADDSGSAVCDRSMEAEDFFYQKEYAVEKMGNIGEIKRDSAGYAESVVLDGKLLSGEYFRERFQLPSANFDIEEKEGKYLITVRGKGHGLGMDLYYANELAKQGWSYNQILDYFFKDFILKKIIV